MKSIPTPSRRAFLRGTLVLAASSLGARAAGLESSVKAYQIPVGRRGQCVQFTARLVLGGKAAGAGFPIHFTERVGRRVRRVGIVPTDDKGWARLSYAIPMDPHADNIHLSAEFPGGQPAGTLGILWFASKSPEMRVPISR